MSTVFSAGRRFLFLLLPLLKNALFLALSGCVVALSFPYIHTRVLKHFFFRTFFMHVCVCVCILLQTAASPLDRDVAKGWVKGGYGESQGGFQKLGLCVVASDSGVFLCTTSLLAPLAAADPPPPSPFLPPLCPCSLCHFLYSAVAPCLLAPPFGPRLWQPARLTSKFEL